MLTTKMIRLGLMALSIVLFTACGGSNTGNDTTDTAIDKLVAYANSNGTGDTPSVQDYIDAGVSGVTEENLASINAVVAGLTEESVDTQEEVQAIADENGVEITANIPPIAKAGSPETTVEEGSTVYFSSRHSTDTDGEIVKYQWYENGVSVAKVPSFWKVYNIAGEYTIKLVVTDDDGATSSAQYTVTVEEPPPPPARSQSNTDFENTTETPLTDAGGSLGAAIPFSTEIEIDASNAVFSIDRITVTINISHTWIGDLDITLRSPNGTIIHLIDRHGYPASSFGTAGANYENTTFDDDAVTAIEAGSPPFSGSFIPEEPLASFMGENATGTWTLSIEDNEVFDTGTFHSWSMTIE